MKKILQTTLSILLLSVSANASCKQTLPARYELKEGDVIPAKLISGMTSDLHGGVMATITHDVYDNSPQYHLIIPNKSRICGQYCTDPVSGELRFLVIWQCIVFPDGRSINLGGASDGFGRLHDLSCNHMRSLLPRTPMISNLRGFSDSVFGVQPFSINKGSSFTVLVKEDTSFSSRYHASL